MPAEYITAGARLAGVGAGIHTSSQHKSIQRKALRLQEKYNRQQQRNYERAITRGVQDRVADAKAAGISPLAALGVSGSSLPNFSVGSPPAGTYSGMSAVADVAEGLAEFQAAREGREERRQDDLFREEMKNAQAARAKLHAETDAVRYQTAAAAQRLAERRLATFGTTALAEHDAGKTKLPLFVRYYDNRKEMGPLLAGEYDLVAEEAAESMEGTTPSGIMFGVNAPNVGTRLLDMVFPKKYPSIQERWPGIKRSVRATTRRNTGYRRSLR